MDDVDAKIGGEVFERLTVGRSAVVMVGIRSHLEAMVKVVREHEGDIGLHSRHTSPGRGNCACHRETFDRTIQKPRQRVVGARCTTGPTTRSRALIVSRNSRRNSASSPSVRGRTTGSAFCTRTGSAPLVGTRGVSAARRGPPCPTLVTPRRDNLGPAISWRGVVDVCRQGSRTMPSSATPER
jgi:hypothetical protein